MDKVKGRKPVKTAAAPAIDHARFLAAILEHPDDDAPRLAYADALTKAGDPRGEFIAVQVQLAVAKSGSAERRALARRDTALFGKHGEPWTKHAMKVCEQATLKRGFVELVAVAGTKWAQHGAALLARDPIRHVYIEGKSAKQLAAVAGAKHTAKLRRLEVELDAKRPSDTAALNAFLRSPYVGAVRELVIETTGALGLDLFDGVSLPATESLELRLLAAPPAVFEGLAQLNAPKLRALNTRGIAKRLPALRSAFANAALT